MIDVQCAATRAHARCQLYAGHVGVHAVLTIDDFGLVLRQWGRTGEHRDESITAHTPLPYPWAPGSPTVVPAAEAPCDEVEVVA